MYKILMNSHIAAREMHRVKRYRTRAWQSTRPVDGLMQFVESGSRECWHWPLARRPSRPPVCPCFPPLLAARRSTAGAACVGRVQDNDGVLRAFASLHFAGQFRRLLVLRPRHSGAGCMVVVCYGHATFFLLSQQYAGEHRAGSRRCVGSVTDSCRACS